MSQPQLAALQRCCYIRETDLFVNPTKVCALCKRGAVQEAGIPVQCCECTLLLQIKGYGD